MFDRFVSLFKRFRKLDATTRLLFWEFIIMITAVYTSLVLAGFANAPLDLITQSDLVPINNKIQAINNRINENQGRWLAYRDDQDKKNDELNNTIKALTLSTHEIQRRNLKLEVDNLAAQGATVPPYMTTEVTRLNNLCKRLRQELGLE